MNEAEVLKKLIEKRRSIYPRDYSGEKIPGEILAEVIYSADFAPSHKKTKPWRFHAFRETDKNILATELQRIYRTWTPDEIFLRKKWEDIGLKMTKTDTVIAIVVNFSGRVPEWEELAATAMAVQNMYLTCTANNVGCYWSSPAYISYLSDFLQLSGNQRCLGLFYMGMIKS